MTDKTVMISDFYCAAALHADGVCPFPAPEWDRVNRIVVFRYVMTDGLAETLDRFHAGKLFVDARTYAQALKRAKSLVFSVADRHEGVS